MLVPAFWQPTAQVFAKIIKDTSFGICPDAGKKKQFTRKSDKLLNYLLIHQINQKKILVVIPEGLEPPASIARHSPEKIGAAPLPMPNFLPVW